MVIKHLRQHFDRPCFLGNGPQAGGVAKSAGVMQTSSIAILAGLKVGFIDADRTTEAISISVDSARFPVMKIEDTPEFVKKAVAKFVGCDIVFVDYGAAQLSDRETMLPTMSLIKEWGGVANSALVLNQIPHKTGLGSDLKRIAGFMQEWTQIRIARHDVDGTGQFAKLPEELAPFPVHDVQHSPPNLNDLWRSPRLLPSDFVVNPPAGYELAAAKIAEHLLLIATSNHFAEWIGAAAAIPVLRRAATPALQYVPRYLAGKLTNDALVTYNDVQQAIKLVRHAVSDNDCISAVRIFQAADQAHHRAIA